jgi:hypothetical protein
VLFTDRSLLAAFAFRATEGLETEDPGWTESMDFAQDEGLLIPQFQFDTEHYPSGGHALQRASWFGVSVPLGMRGLNSAPAGQKSELSSWSARIINQADKES